MPRTPLADHVAEFSFRQRDPAKGGCWSAQRTGQLNEQFLQYSISKLILSPPQCQIHTKLLRNESEMLSLQFTAKRTLISLILRVNLRCRGSTFTTACMAGLQRPVTQAPTAAIAMKKSVPFVATLIVLIEWAFQHSGNCCVVRQI